MNVVKTKIKTPISYYGGKQSMLKHIIPMIPKHNLYTEAFCGGAALFFAKEPANVEVINDINSNLINFYKVLKLDYIELKKKIDATLHSRREHIFAQIVLDMSEYFNDVTRAWALWVLSKQSFASKLDGSWGYDKKSNTMPKKITNAKKNFAELLGLRLENTQIECNDALRIITSRDTTEAFHFIDPPYFNSNCGHYSGYNEQNFEDLLKVMETLKGKFILTMFPCEILDKYVERNGWNVKKIERTISASKTARNKKTEIIVFNYDLNTA